MTGTPSPTRRAKSPDPTASSRTIDLSIWKGRTAVDASGEEVGEIAEVYPDASSGEVHWLAISTGWCGTVITFASAEGARAAGDVVTLAA